jgi:hypothetical protein
MAVAALQVQAQQIKAQQTQLDALGAAQAASCR